MDETTKNSGFLFIDSGSKAAFEQLGFISIDDVFAFDAGQALSKSNLAPHRCRLHLYTPIPACRPAFKPIDILSISDSGR